MDTIGKNWFLMPHLYKIEKWSIRARRVFGDPMMSFQVWDEETKIQGVKRLARDQTRMQFLTIFASPTTSSLNPKPPKCCELFNYDAS